MLKLKSGLVSLTSSYSRISRFVVNISVRNKNGWFEEEELFLDEDPEVFSRSDTARMKDENRKLVKRKILQKKNFPMPKEAPILTWEAREQMKFLNKEFPEEWTLDKIVESFPVSRSTAIQILKSKSRIWTEETIIKYNKKVQKNLKALQEGDVEGNEELTNVRNSLTAGNKMSLLSNSGGLKGLPMPTHEQSYSDLPKDPSFQEQLAQLRVNPFTSILAKYNRLEPITAEKEEDETETRKMLPVPKAQHKGKGKTPYGEKFQSRDSLRSPYGNDPRSKFDASRNVKSAIESKSHSSHPGKFIDSLWSECVDSPRSKAGDHDLPRMKSADLPKSEYIGNSSRSKVGHTSAVPQLRDSPKSKFGKSQKLPYESSQKRDVDDISYADVHDLEDSDLTKTEIGDLLMMEIHNSSQSKFARDSVMTSKSHASSRSKSQVSSPSKSRDSPMPWHDDDNSSLPSMTDIGSENVESLYMDQVSEEGDAVQSEVTKGSAKIYLSRKEKKKLQQAKTEQLPSFATWDQKALHGTGIKK